MQEKKFALKPNIGSAELTTALIANKKTELSKLKHFDQLKQVRSPYNHPSVKERKAAIIKGKFKVAHSWQTQQNTVRGRHKPT